MLVKKGAHSTQQKDINQLLVDYALQGKVVARLKGGDPMVFGRCGEEMSALNEHHIYYEIIPGITSAISVPTNIGVPITHRDCSHSVAFVTATRANDIGNTKFPNADTLIIMMSLLRLSEIVKHLKVDRPGSTPIAIVQSGTYAAQRRLVGTLDSIEADQAAAGLVPPALMIVGDVVRLHATFDWRAHLPLNSHRFVLFRSSHQVSDLAGQLSSLGAEVLHLPLNDIQLIPQTSLKEDVSCASHLIFTSENGVHGLMRQCLSSGIDGRFFAGKEICAIGTHTAKVCQSYGLIPDVIPETATGHGIVEHYHRQLGSNHTVLIPTTPTAGQTLDALGKSGASVIKRHVYNNVEPEDTKDFMNWLNPSDIFIYMNSASVERCQRLYPNMIHHSSVSIGPKTTKTLLDYGAKPPIQSSRSSKDNILETILESFSKKQI